MSEGDRQHRIGGLLTERQLQILELRKQNLTQEETARKLGISRQDVSILERRALRNINTAADTIQMAENVGLIKRARIGSGLHILDVAKEIIRFADGEQVKIKSTALGIMTLIQAAASSYLDNGIVTVSLEAIILPDGRVSINTVQ
ncbi:MAG TPA: Tfx family DNA-binding protein [Thermoplasmataceae archaeon]|nr:Tfx family DNA-binding protein [Thermoplasmataceae archaeon]